MTLTVVSVLVPAALTFALGILLTPIVTHFLYAHKAWKKKAGKKAYGGGETPVFNELHKDRDVGTPRMGGIVIWASVLGVTASTWLAAILFDSTFLDTLDFVSRSQTWIPLGAFFVGSLVGFIDDLYEVRGSGSYFAGGLPLRYRLIVVGAVASFAAWWFYYKLGVESISVPFFDTLTLGFLFPVVFIAIALLMYAGGVIDGIDGLAGGVFAIIFSAYATIAFAQSQFDIAALCATLAGGILAFLWFNIPPARFYMTETGVMGLTMALTIIAFMTDTVADGRGVSVLPIIALPLVVTVLSNIVQLLSKKIRGKKLLRIAPLHHHFEAIGWPGYKVTMRYWVISVFFAFIGLIMALVG